MAGKFAWSHLCEYLSHVKPWRRDAWNLRSWSSSSRALSWHDGHLHSLGGNSANCDFWWKVGQETRSGSQWQCLGLATNLAMCWARWSNTLYQLLVQSPLPVANEHPRFYFIPCRCGLYHALIALRANGCEALIFEASHGLGVALRQSFVIVTCFNLGLPNHRQCLLVLAALYVTVYLADCKQMFLKKMVCSSAQRAQTVWLHTVSFSWVSANSSIAAI